MVEKEIQAGIENSPAPSTLSLLGLLILECPKHSVTSSLYFIF